MTYTTDDLNATALAIDLCQRAVLNQASITSIEASDAANCYRSVESLFSVDESAAIFNAAIAVLQNRLASTTAAASG